MAAAVSALVCVAASPEEGAAGANGGRLLVCIDPGHPSPFSGGATSTVDRKITEVHMNWLVGQKLAKILKSKGVSVMFTKTSEPQNVDNQERAHRINGAAESFLRENPRGRAVAVHLHCDSSTTKGFTIYYPDQQGIYGGPTGREPNQGFKGPPIGIQKSSRLLANAVAPVMRRKLAGAVSSEGVMGDSKTKVGGRGHHGALTFSIFSKVPTITIEMVVLDNASDVAFIRTDEGQQRMADAIAAGLLAY